MHLFPARNCRLHCSRHLQRLARRRLHHLYTGLGCWQHIQTELQLQTDLVAGFHFSNLDAPTGEFHRRTR